MSRENVELISNMLAEAPTRIEAMLEILDEGVQWDPGSHMEVAGNGPEAVREFFRSWVGAFEGWGYDVEEVVDAGDSVVVRVHQWGRGKGSGVEVDNRFWQIWTVRAGRVTRITNHVEKAEALAAAGESG